STSRSNLGLGTAATHAATDFLQATNNLSDVQSVVTSRSNLGLSLPLSAASGGTGVVSPTAHSLPVGEGSSAMTFLGPLTNGQLLIGSTGADPVPANLNAGSGISISIGPGSIIISGTGSGTGWTEVTGTTQLMSADNGYVTNNASLVTLTL